MRTIFLSSILIPLAACSGGHITSDKEAELAYVGLDRAVERALDLGLQGYSEASSANIEAQSEAGEVSGTMTVTGKVDQGSSDNKGLRLDLLLEDYADVEDVDEEDPEEEDHLFVAYDTDPDDQPYYELKLRDIPEGTLEGDLLGVVLISGDLVGEVLLDLSLSGELTSDGADGVSRVPDTCVVTGTVTNDRGGVYEVDLVL